MHHVYRRFLRFKEHWLDEPEPKSINTSCQFATDKPWLDLQYHGNGQIKKPGEVENEMVDPPGLIDEQLLDQIEGSLIGMAVGDALGAHVEFRPHEYLLANPVNDFEGGGTWGLKKGQFTDDTSMALCLANSLVSRHGFVPYDQLVRYKWWYRHGYMSSTGQCFDIGEATRHSIQIFERRQSTFGKKHNIRSNDLDYLSDRHLLEKFKVCCSSSGVAGNGALMRLAPVPLFFHKHLAEAISLSGYSGQITHGDEKAYDACRYYGALIFAALNGYKKEELLADNFYVRHKPWFGEKLLCKEVQAITEGSFKKTNGYNDGIRGKGYIVDALEAALWAFWSDENSFEKGALAAVNLGDDTDTTAAIYGQLAGAYYGYRKLPKKWTDQIYARRFILNLSKWIAYEGEHWKRTQIIVSSKSPSSGMITANSVENLLFDTPVALSYQSQSDLRPNTVPTKRKERSKDVLAYDDPPFLPRFASMSPPNGPTIPPQYSSCPSNSNDMNHSAATMKAVRVGQPLPTIHLTPKLPRERKYRAD